VLWLGFRQLRLWDIGLGKCVVVYRTPKLKPVWDVAFSPLGQLFVSGSYDRGVRVWCAERPEKPLRLMMGHYSDVSSVAWPFQRHLRPVGIVG
jgi:transcription initiation factor TFIID subunit 5